MPRTPTARLGLVGILGSSDLINQGDDAINAIIDRLDAVLAPVDSGLLASRPVSTSGSPGIRDRRYYATDAFTTFRDTGTGWTIVSQTPQVAAVLPSGTGIPFDGQEIYFLADATNGIVWHLRYRAASTSAYKWEVVGGVTDALAEVGSAESTASGSYTDLTTFGPSITVPLAGDYDVEYGATMMHNANGGGAYLAVAVGGAGAADADAARFVQAGTTTDAQATISRRRRKLAVAAAASITAKYRTSTASATFFDRFLRVRPVRVG